MSYFYGIPSLQSVTEIGNTTSQTVTFNGQVINNNLVSFTSTANFSSDLWIDTDIFAYFGTSQENGIRTRGVDLCIDTLTSGAGGIVYVGDGVTPGSLLAGTLGLGQSTPALTPLLSADSVSSSVAGAISSTIEHTGATSTMRAMLMTSIHAGSATNQNAVGGYFQAQLKTKNSGTAQIFGVNGLATLNAAVSIGAGTVNLQNKFEVTGTGGVHTAGTVYSRSMWATEPPTLTGVASQVAWAGLFSGDTQVNTGKKLLLEGSDTVKGDTYFVYDSGSSELQMWVNGTKVLGSTSATLTAYITTSGFGGGGSGNSVTATVDFGASFTDKAQLVVTGQTWVTVNSEIVAHVKTPSGTDPDEMYLINPEVVISDLVAGTGFTVTVYTEAEAKGTYDVMCIGV